MFLTSDELTDLTGYKRHADQRRWLTARGWKFETAATGKPIVSKKFAEQKLSDAANEQSGGWKPNKDAFRRAA